MVACGKLVGQQQGTRVCSEPENQRWKRSELNTAIMLTNSVTKATVTVNVNVITDNNNRAGLGPEAATGVSICAKRDSVNQCTETAIEPVNHQQQQKNLLTSGTNT